MEINGSETFIGALMIFQQLQYELPYSMRVEACPESKAIWIRVWYPRVLFTERPIFSTFGFKEGESKDNLQEFDNFKNFVNEIHNQTYGQDYF